MSVGGITANDYGNKRHPCARVSNLVHVSIQHDLFLGRSQPVCTIITMFDPWRHGHSRVHYQQCFFKVLDQGTLSKTSCIGPIICPGTYYREYQHCTQTRSKNRERKPTRLHQRLNSILLCARIIRSHLGHSTETHAEVFGIPLAVPLVVLLVLLVEDRETFLSA